MSLIKPGELQFAGVLFHQRFEALQRDDFPEGNMDGLGPGFHPEKFLRLICQVGVQTN
jgi:hypothetical protein